MLLIGQRQGSQATNVHVTWEPRLRWLPALPALRHPLSARSRLCPPRPLPQLDFQLPIRFNLEYVKDDGTYERPVIVHRYGRRRLKQQGGPHAT